MAVSGIPALIMCLVFEKFGALRVSHETELIGLDVANWDMNCCGDDLTPHAAMSSATRQQPGAVSGLAS